MHTKTFKNLKRFHRYHGKNVILSHERTVAFRKQSYANGLVFSDTPLKVYDLFALQIQLTERGWTGDMRIGLTKMNPNLAQSQEIPLPEYALPDLSAMRPSWIHAISKSCVFHRKRISNSSRWGDITLDTARGTVTLSSFLPPVQDGSDRLATDVDSQIGVVYIPINDEFAELHFIVNGVDQGAFADDIPYKEGPFYVVVDVYGCTKQVRIIQAKFRVPALQEICRKAILQSIKQNGVAQLPIPNSLKEYLLKSGAYCPLASLSKAKNHRFVDVPEKKMKLGGT